MRIQVENVSKSIQGKPILSDVSFTLETGQSLALIGPNGSGKSTLLRVIAGLLPAEQGQVTIGDDKVNRLSPRALAQRLGFVTQEVGTTDAIAVQDAVKLGRTPWLSFAKPFGPKDQRIVDQAMREMAIDGYKATLFNALSGGENSGSISPAFWHKRLRFSCWTNPPTIWTFVIRSQSWIGSNGKSPLC